MLRNHIRKIEARLPSVARSTEAEAGSSPVILSIAVGGLAARLGLILSLSLIYLDGIQAAPAADTLEASAVPSIVVPGGTTWPAGHPIDIQIREHEANTVYDAYFDGTKIATVQTNADGDFTIIGYEIPATTPLGAHIIRTTLFNDSATVASLDIVVTDDPFLLIDGGNIWRAGETILVVLKQHASNTVYDIYFADTFLRKVTTDVSGGAAFHYPIPGITPGGDYAITSRQGTTIVASTSLTVIEAELVFLPLIVQ